MAGALAWFCIYGAIGDLRPLVVLFAFGGLLALAAGLLNVWAPFNALGVGCLGAAYLALVYSQGGELGAAAPAVAAALLLVAELAWYSLELAGSSAHQPRLLARRLALIGAQAVGAVGLGYLLLLIAAAPLPAGVAYTAAGATATLAAVGVLTRLVGSRRGGGA